MNETKLSKNKLFLVCMCIVTSVTSNSATLWTVASMGFSRQEYWSGLPFPPPGDLPNPGMETSSLMSPALEVDSLPLVLRGKPQAIP